jgi:hypothetical protein
MFASGIDPADFSHMAYALSCDNGILYYGDNYGGANSAGQFYATGRNVYTVLGVRPTGDSQCLAYWADTDADDETWIRGLMTASATLYEVKNGVGLCGGGFGGWVHLDGQDGMYFATTESRIGRSTGYFIQGASIIKQETLAEPLTGSNFFTRALAFSSPQDDLTIITAEEAPVSLVTHFNKFDGTFTQQEIGGETWAHPDCAAPDSVPGEILLGSLYVTHPGDSDLILSRFAPGDTQGEHTLTVKGQSQACMFYNPKSQQTMLVSLDSATHKVITARAWDQASGSWSAPSTLFNAPTAVFEVIVRPRPDGEWGAAWDEADGHLRLAETVGGVWQAPVVQSSAPLDYPEGSFDLAYSPAGDAGFVAERQAPQAGIWYGHKAPSSSVANWELASTSKGVNSSQLNSFEMHWLPEGPVITYNVNALLFGGGSLRVTTKQGDNWNTTGVEFYMTAFPLGFAQNSLGMLAFAGQDNSTGEGTVCFLDW